MISSDEYSHFDNQIASFRHSLSHDLVYLMFYLLHKKVAGTGLELVTSDLRGDNLMI